MYLEAINRASRNVWMTQAYFLPDQDFVDAVKDARAGRGVDVRLLVPLKSNHIVADWISRGYFAELLEAGVRIFRYQDAMVHAKTATVDGSWSTVGTANIDRLSLQGNYEINVEVIDQAWRRTLEEICAADESNCLELTSGEWEARDLHRKFTESFPRPAPSTPLNPGPFNRVASRRPEPRSVARDDCLTSSLSVRCERPVPARALLGRRAGLGDGRRPRGRIALLPRTTPGSGSSSSRPRSRRSSRTRCTSTSRARP